MIQKMTDALKFKIIPWCFSVSARDMQLTGNWQGTDMQLSCN